MTDPIPEHLETNRWKSDRPVDFWEENNKKNFWSDLNAETIRNDVQHEIDRLKDKLNGISDSIENDIFDEDELRFWNEYKTKAENKEAELINRIEELNSSGKSEPTEPTKTKWTPKPRQDLAIHKFVQFSNENNKKAFLLLHNVGSGKTITSLQIALNNLSLNFKKNKAQEDFAIYQDLDANAIIELHMQSLKNMGNYQNKIRAENRISVVCPTGIYNNYIQELSKLLYIEKLSEQDNESIEIDPILDPTVTKRTTFKYIGINDDKQNTTLPDDIENRFIVDEILWKNLYKKIEENDRKVYKTFENAITIFDECHRLFRLYNSINSYVEKAIEGEWFCNSKKNIYLTATPFGREFNDYFSLINLIKLNNGDSNFLSEADIIKVDNYVELQLHMVNLSMGERARMFGSVAKNKVASVTGTVLDVVGMVKNPIILLNHDPQPVLNFDDNPLPMADRIANATTSVAANGAKAFGRTAAVAIPIVANAAKAAAVSTGKALGKAAISASIATSNAALSASKYAASTLGSAAWGYITKKAQGGKLLPSLTDCLIFFNLDEEYDLPILNKKYKELALIYHTDLCINCLNKTNGDTENCPSCDRRNFQKLVKYYEILKSNLEMPEMPEMLTYLMSKLKSNEIDFFIENLDYIYANKDKYTFLIDTDIQTLVQKADDRKLAFLMEELIKKSFEKYNNYSKINNSNNYEVYATEQLLKIKSAKLFSMKPIISELTYLLSDDTELIQIGGHPCDDKNDFFNKKIDKWSKWIEEQSWVKGDIQNNKFDLEKLMEETGSIISVVDTQFLTIKTPFIEYDNDVTIQDLQNKFTEGAFIQELQFRYPIKKIYFQFVELTPEQKIYGYLTNHIIVGNKINKTNKTVRSDNKTITNLCLGNYSTDFDYCTSKFDREDSWRPGYNVVLDKMTTIQKPISAENIRDNLPYQIQQFFKPKEKSEGERKHLEKFMLNETKLREVFIQEQEKMKEIIDHYNSNLINDVEYVLFFNTKFAKILWHLLLNKCGLCLNPEGQSKGTIGEDVRECYERIRHLQTSDELNNDPYKTPEDLRSNRIDCFYNEDEYDEFNGKSDAEKIIEIERMKSNPRQNKLIDDSTDYFLPLIYSNSDEMGINLFCSFLQSLNLSSIVFHDNMTSNSLEREKIRGLNKTYKLFPVNKRQPILEILNKYKDRIFTKYTLVDMLRDIKEQHVINILNEPMGILLHPHMTEGIDCVYNPALYLMEPAQNFPNYEQICGRIMRTYPFQYMLEPIKYIYIFISYEEQRLKEIYDKQGDDNLVDDVIFKDFFQNKKPILQLRSTIEFNKNRKITSTSTKPNSRGNPQLLEFPEYDPITIFAVTGLRHQLLDTMAQWINITKLWRTEVTQSVITELKLNETYAYNSIKTFGEINSQIIPSSTSKLNELSNVSVLDAVSQAWSGQSNLNLEEFKSYVSYFIKICYRLPFESNLIFHLIFEDLSKIIENTIQNQSTWRYFELFVIELVFLYLFKDFKINDSTRYTDSNLITYLNVSYEEKLFAVLKQRYVDKENDRNRPDDFLIIEEITRGNENNTIWCNFQNLNMANRCKPFEPNNDDDDDDDDDDGGVDDYDMISAVEMPDLDNGFVGIEMQNFPGNPPPAIVVTANAPRRLRSRKQAEPSILSENILCDLTDWEQVDDWVIKYLDVLKQTGNVLSIGTENTMLADHTLGRLFTCLSGSKIYEAGSSGVFGKNDCLIHSILAAVSPTFRQIGGLGGRNDHNRKRNYIAHFFRRILIPYWITQNTFRLPSSTKKPDILGDTFLDERLGEAICTKLQLNVIWLQKPGRAAASASGNQYEHTIGIFGNHVHFQPVYFTTGSKTCPSVLVKKNENVGFTLPKSKLDPVAFQELMSHRLNEDTCLFNVGQRVTINGEAGEYEIIEAYFPKVKSGDPPPHCDRLRLQGPFVMVKQKGVQGQDKDDISDIEIEGKSFGEIIVSVKDVTLLQNGGRKRALKRISKKTLNKRISKKRISKKTLNKRISKKTLNKRISKKH